MPPFLPVTMRKGYRYPRSCPGCSTRCVGWCRQRKFQPRPPARPTPSPERTRPCRLLNRRGRTERSSSFPQPDLALSDCSGGAGRSPQGSIREWPMGNWSCGPVSFQRFPNTSPDSALARREGGANVAAEAAPPGLEVGANGSNAATAARATRPMTSAYSTVSAPLSSRTKRLIRFILMCSPLFL